MGVALAVTITACSPANTPETKMVEKDVKVEKVIVNDGGTEINSEPSQIETDFAALTREDFNSGFAAWVGLKPGMDSDEAMAIIEERFGETIEGEGGLTVDIQTLYRPKGLTVILATQEGALDDSIYAQQLYAEFEPVSPVANKLVFYGLRQKCQRGENTTEWTTQRCP